MESLRNARANIHEKCDDLEEENISIRIGHRCKRQHDNQYKLSFKIIKKV